MENLFYNISQVLGITIIHSLWQGLIIYMLLRMYVQSFPAALPVIKYKIAYTALMVMLGWFIFTLYTEVNRYNWHPTSNNFTALPAVWDNRYSFVFAGYLPYVTMLYFAGLIFNTLKLMLAWNNSYRIRQNVLPAGFEQQVNKLSAKLGLKKHVQVGFSEWVDVPCITGYLKPIILLPFTIGNYLNAEEIAAILLHELAHVRRNDYLLNIIQQAVGIFLFFNPFARLTGKLINQERENCCDDAVVHITGSPLIYAKALLKLEENKQQQWHLSLAAKNKSFDLLNRIERIMKTKKNSVNIRPALIAVVLLGCSLSCLAWLNPKMGHGKISVKANVPAVVKNVFANTTKKSDKPGDKPARKNHIAVLNYNRLDTINDPHLQQLLAKVEKHGQNVQQHFESDRFKTSQKELAKVDSDLQAYFNSPKMKKWEAELDKQAMQMDNADDNPEIKQWQKKMEELGNKMVKMYSDPKYIGNQKELEKIGEHLAKLDPNSKEFAKESKRIAELTKRYADAVNTPEFKANQRQIAETGKKISEYYNSDAFKARNQAIKTFSDSIAAYAKAGDIKSKSRDIAQKIKDEIINSTAKADMKELEQSSKELEEYIKAKGYNKIASKQNYQMNFDYNVDTTHAPRKAKTPKPVKQAEPIKSKSIPPPPPPIEKQTPAKHKSIPPPPPPAPPVEKSGNDAVAPVQ